MESQDLNSLRQRVVAELEEKGYGKQAIGAFNRTMNRLEQFMSSAGFWVYSPDMGKSFLQDLHSSKDYSELTFLQKYQVRHVNFLSDMLNYGHLFYGNHRRKDYSFKKLGQEAFGNFLSFMTDKRSEATIENYKKYLEPLYDFLLEKGKKIGDIEIPLMVQFLAQIKKTKTASVRHHVIQHTRVFFRFLCENNLLKDNNIERWLQLLCQSKNKEKKLPSSYSKEEVDIIIAAIDRGNPKGKRDYAIIILLARTALRAKDITSLRFSNLDWNKYKIKLRQSKNKKMVEFDIDDEIEEALVDYLKNGRPNIEIPFVFTTCDAPYKQMSPSTLSHIVKKIIAMAGIKTNGRKQGPHALRHSLATALLKEGATLTVIAEILGHTDTQSTTNYIGVDIEQLRKCALDVPLVPSTFYEGLYGKN